MKRPTSDAPAAPEGGPPTDASRLAGRAARLLVEARAYRPRVGVTLADIETALEARRQFLPGRSRPLLVGGLTTVGMLLGLGSLAMSRGWLGRVEPETPTLLSVPAGGNASVVRRGRFHMSIDGEAALEMRSSDDRPVRLDQGTLIVSSERRAVEVETGGHHLTVPASATVRVETSATGPRVSSLKGPVPLMDGVPVASRRPAATEPSAAGGVSAGGNERRGPAEEPSERTPLPPPVEAEEKAVASPGVPVPRAQRAAPKPALPAMARPAPMASAGAAAPMDESAYVREALAQLRAGGDGAAALALLEGYDRRFPNGLLAEEARLIRVEALLSLGRNGEALRSLESFPAATIERSRRLRVARGELRAAAGHCDQAVQDFTAILASPSDDDLRHRAQRGRDACARVTQEGREVSR